jgi:hypothetical protein
MFHRGTRFLAAAVLMCSGSLALAEQAPAADPAAPAATPPAPAAPATPASDAAKARAAAVAAKANIDVNEGWTRATAGDATTVIVSMKISSVKDPDRLLSIDAAIAEKAEIQEEASQNGAVKAGTVQMLDIPGGATVEFKMGGRRLVLTGLKAPLKEGESFLITLKFDKAGTESTPVKVLGTSATGLPPVGSTRKGDSTAAVSQR